MQLLKAKVFRKQSLSPKSFLLKNPSIKKLMINIEKMSKKSLQFISNSILNFTTRHFHEMTASQSSTKM